MKAAWASFLLLAAAACGTSGCTSRMELVERGFVQAAALDRGPEGIRLTVQVYKPGPSVPEGQATAGKKHLEIGADNATVFGAVRDVSLELGRKLQWSHMPVLLIGEELAKEGKLRDILDFFSRDHEPRGTTYILIAQGKAGDYFKLDPLIESTMGQQLSQIQKKTTDFVGKALSVTLTDLQIDIREEVAAVALPYIRMRKERPAAPEIGGLALLEFPSGKLKGVLPPDRSPFILMAMNRFREGILNLPCPGPARESFEVHRTNSKISPRIIRDSLALDVRIELEGTVGELTCSTVMTPDQTKAYLRKIERTAADGVRSSVKELQRHRSDVIDVGNTLYRTHTRTWKRWKADWPTRFAEAEVKVEVKAKLLDTGMTTGEKM